jgi:hypothetical protein
MRARPLWCSQKNALARHSVTMPVMTCGAAGVETESIVTINPTQMARLIWRVEMRELRLRRKKRRRNEVRAKRMIKKAPDDGWL